MRRGAELGRSAAVLGQRRVWGLPLLLLLELGQTEEQAQDGLQIPITDLCGTNRRELKRYCLIFKKMCKELTFCGQALDVDSLRCQKTEADVDVLNLKQRKSQSFACLLHKLFSGPSCHAELYPHLHFKEGARVIQEVVGPIFQKNE